MISHLWHPVCCSFTTPIEVPPIADDGASEGVIVPRSYTHCEPT
jgi:hypothetical protein